MSALILGALPLGLAVYWADELPRPMASHWGMTGRADGSMGVGGFMALFGLHLVVATALIASAGMVRRMKHDTRRNLAVFGGFLASVLGGLLLWTTWVQRGLPTWRHAPDMTLSALLVGAAVSALMGQLLGHLTVGWPGDFSDPYVGGARPTVGLSPDERAVWSRRISAPWVYLLVVPELGMVAYGLWGDVPALALGGVVVCMILVEMTTCRVTVDEGGLTMRWGSFGLWRHSIPLAEITRAEAIDVEPMAWGGWGYRGSMFLMGKAAVVLRKGPGIRLELKGSRVFAVTVDDAETAAGLLNDLVARQS
ncbi:MAG: hypothetical protein H6726_14720 [Sandaracinaceae bacterium]|nr:hypothetical protein [Sandaracinaceae bacterium]